MAVCGIAFGGPLAFLLRSLLQNDSLMDIGRRSALYWMVVRLVQSLGTSSLPSSLPCAAFKTLNPKLINPKLRTTHRPMSIGRHSALYWMVVRLVQSLGASPLKSNQIDTLKAALQGNAELAPRP